MRSAISRVMCSVVSWWLPRLASPTFATIVATRKWKAEGFDRPWPAMIEMDRATKAKVNAMWAKLGL